MDSIIITEAGKPAPLLYLAGRTLSHTGHRYRLMRGGENLMAFRPTVLHIIFHRGGYGMKKMNKSTREKLGKVRLNPARVSAKLKSQPYQDLAMQKRPLPLGEIAIITRFCSFFSGTEMNWRKIIF